MQAGDVTTALTVSVFEPVPASLPADPPEGVSLDATHVKYATQAVKITAPAGKDGLTADLFPSYKPRQAETIGIWVYVEPTALSPNPQNGYANVGMGRIGQAGSLPKLMGCDQMNGLHAGWNLCLFTSMAWQSGATVQFTCERGGSILVDSLIANPPTQKGVIVFTHDVSPSRSAVNLTGLYAEYGLPFDWDSSATHSGVTDKSIQAMRDAGLTDWGVYSGMEGGGRPDEDYLSGDWTQTVQAMTQASRIDGLPRASYVASTNNRLGPAYTSALTQAGWPLIRGTYGGGVATSIDPARREVMTVPYDKALAGLETWARAGYITVVTAHDVPPDDQVTGDTDTKQSEYKPLLALARRLIDAGDLECLTMRQLAERYTPNALNAWDRQTN